MTFDSSTDEIAIHNVVAAVEAGWNAGDGSRFAAPFAEDADYVIVDGRYAKGRQLIAQGHQQLFDTIYRDSHNVATVQRIRFIGDDLGIAHRGQEPTEVDAQDVLHSRGGRTRRGAESQLTSGS